MNPEQVEEVEALKAIYDEDFRVVDELEKALRITIRSDDKSLSLDLLFVYPDDYPGTSPPVYEIKNAYWIGDEGQRQIRSHLMSIFDENRGNVILYQWIEAVREFLNDKASEENVTSQESDKEEHVSDTGLEDVDKAAVKAVHLDRKEILCPLILHGNPLTDRKSTFQAHLAQVHTTEEVETVLAELKTNKKIATASHNILAYRLHNETRGVFYQDYDDDGETAAGGRLLHLLQIMDVRNVMVVVSRWFGGILLHADRFKHINNVARILLLESGVGEKKPTAAAAGSAKSKTDSNHSTNNTKQSKHRH